LQLTPLRVEQDRGYFDNWFSLDRRAIREGGATEAHGVRPLSTAISTHIAEGEVYF
jgi:hypothetical protein